MDTSSLGKPIQTAIAGLPIKEIKTFGAKKATMAFFR
jgi:hypothetical protein